MEAYGKSIAIEAGTREGVEAGLFLGDVAMEQKSFAGAFDFYSKSAERASADELVDIRARSYFGMGRAAAAQEKWEDAARYFMSVGLLFDDQKLVPESLYRAAEAWRKLGRTADADKALEELKTRYPGNEWSAK
jgi:tetratricopeptide (TPR) repeat protein